MWVGCSRASIKTRVARRCVELFARIESMLARALRPLKALSAVKVPDTWLPRLVKLLSEDPVG